MNNDTEINIIKGLQTLPRQYFSSVTKIMSLVSTPFHCKFYIFIILFLYLKNKISKNQLFMLISSQFIIFTIKYMVKRKRPFQTNPDIKLLEPMNFDPYSFPSGHTLNAFLLSYIVKKNMNINIYPIAYMVGLSRVFMGVHYPSDIIGAIVLAKVIIHFL